MRKKRPRVASADEVRITRDGEAALIEFADSSIASPSSISTTRNCRGRNLGGCSSPMRAGPCASNSCRTIRCTKSPLWKCVIPEEGSGEFGLQGDETPQDRRTRLDA